MFLGTDAVSVCFRFLICEMGTALPCKVFVRIKLGNISTVLNALLATFSILMALIVSTVRFIVTVTNDNSSSAASFTTKMLSPLVQASFCQSSGTTMAVLFIFKTILFASVSNASMTRVGSDLTCLLSKSTEKCS